jgi:putative acyl-CoA dehydrogenase
MRRAIALATDYASRRIAFGKPLAGHPLHAETLAALELEWRAGFLLTFEVVEMLGKQETEVATPEELARLRLLIPVAKLYTAKQAVAVASEAIESFGGAGYVEDTGLPRLLRDAQVLSIWEGTTNVLSLDVLRAIEKTNGLPALIADARERLEAIRNEQLATSSARVAEALVTLQAFAERAAQEGREFAELYARAFSYGIARAVCGLLLLEHAQWSAANGADPFAMSAATRWCGRDLTTLENAEGPVPSPILLG